MTRQQRPDTGGAPRVVGRAAQLGSGATAAAAVLSHNLRPGPATLTAGIVVMAVALAVSWFYRPLKTPATGADGADGSGDPHQRTQGREL